MSRTIMQVISREEVDITHAKTREPQSSRARPRGSGRCTRKLAGRGHDIVLAARNEERLREKAAKMPRGNRPPDRGYRCRSLRRFAGVGPCRTASERPRNLHSGQQRRRDPKWGPTRKRDRVPLNLTWRSPTAVTAPASARRAANLTFGTSAAVADEQRDDEHRDEGHPQRTLERPFQRPARFRAVEQAAEFDRG